MELPYTKAVFTPCEEDTDVDCEEMGNVHHIQINGKIFEVQDEDLDKLQQKQIELQESMENINNALIGINIVKNSTNMFGLGVGIAEAINIVNDYLNNASQTINLAVCGITLGIIGGLNLYYKLIYHSCENDFSIAEQDFEKTTEDYKNRAVVISEDLDNKDKENNVSYI